jgi:hypothetical protein
MLKKSRGHASRTLDEKYKFTHIDDDFWKRNDLNGAEDLSVLKGRDDVVRTLACWGRSA